MEPIFDRDLMIRRRRRALARPDHGAAFLLDRAAGDLVERLSTVQRQFGLAATLFCPTPTLGALLRGSGKVDRVVSLEPDDSGAELLDCEAESLDLVASLYCLQDMNDLPGMLVQIRRALRADGLFLACMAGSGTLAELREALLSAEMEIAGGASPRVAPFADIRDVGALLQRAGFALPVTDVDDIVVRYDTMFALLRDLRAMGVTSSLTARSRIPATRGLFMRAAEIYAERFSDPDGRIRATFSTVWLSGWAPHHSQQKPLAPGSAQVSLTSIFDDKS